jgi:hypothetical protein
MSSTVRFQIEFEGSSRCWNNANVCAIDLYGPKSQVSARSEGILHLQGERLKWHITNKERSGEKLADEISLASEVAKTIRLTARVFESYESTSVESSDGIIRPGQWAKRHDIPITIEDHAELENEERYLIKVKNIPGSGLRAEFIKLDKQQAKISKPKESKTGGETAAQLMDMLNELDPHRLGVVFSAVNNTAQSFQQTRQVDNVELDSLSVPNLEGLFSRGVSELKQAKEAFKAACRPEVRSSETFKAFTDKYNISCRLIQLETALRRKGVFVQMPSYD